MENDFLTQITNLQQQYYSTHTKNTFFKSQQKIDCANVISQQLDIQTLLNNTIYIIPNTNILFVDYPVFKLYANSQNYNVIIQRIIDKTSEIIAIYGNYELHLMLKSFSISAAERHKDVVRNYYQTCANANTDFANLINRLCIYHTPNVMENIITMFSAFLDPAVKRKMVLFSKSESDALLRRINLSV